MFSPSTHDPHVLNLSVYGTPEIVDDFVNLNGLMESEKRIFRYIETGKRIFDVGVGGGRTTPHLSGIASEYLAGDYSELMLENFENKFPNVKTKLIDVSEPWPFQDGSFDVIVFSFNGVDTLFPEKRRAVFFAESQRTLSRGGLLIFSSHNPRCLLALHEKKPSSIRERAFNLLDSCRYLVSFLRSSAFWKGRGYFKDPYGGLMEYAASPLNVMADTQAAGFEFLDVVNGRFPVAAPASATPWYYYAFRKP